MHRNGVLWVGRDLKTHRIPPLPRAGPTPRHQTGRGHLQKRGCRRQGHLCSPTISAPLFLPRPSHVALVAASFSSSTAGEQGPAGLKPACRSFFHAQRPDNAMKTPSRGCRAPFSPTRGVDRIWFGIPLGSGEGKVASPSSWQLGAPGVCAGTRSIP